MKIWCYAGLIAALVIGAGARAGERPVVDEGAEERFWFSWFRTIPETAAEQFARARNWEKEGRMRRARRGYRYLVERWPAASEASEAQYRYASLLQAQGRMEAAFEAYRQLLERYPHEVPYDTLMERQYRIALDIMRQKRMRFLFGGYRMPEAALPMFRWIAEQAPGSDLAVNARMKIGNIYEQQNDSSKAIDAYTQVLQLFPDTPQAIEAAIRRALCLDKESRRTPNDAKRLEEAASALRYAERRATNPEQKADLTRRLAEVQKRRARRLFERGRYYEENERDPTAAAIEYRAILREFPEVEPWSGKARKRLSHLETDLSRQEENE